MPAWLFRREMLLLAVALLLALSAGVTLYAIQATVLTIAVAPRDGTEPELIKAYADALATGRENIRLKILSFEDVRESAAALQDGRADLAVVRPDVSLPSNGLTLAILRDQAMIIASPDPSRIKTFPDLAGKRLGITAHKDADFSLLKTILGYYGLSLISAAPAGGLPRDAVLLVPVEEDLAAAFAGKRIDAVVSIIAPSAPKALALVGAVQSASKGGKVAFVHVEDDDAIIERFPRLQAVTVPSGLFAGRPKVPEDDIKTVGASYRLMARSSLGRSVAADVTQHLFEMRTAMSASTVAADYMLAPSYDTTAAATSARLPNHPGAIDYFEREQRNLIDRYGDAIYLLGFLAGGLASAFAWLRQRLGRLRRERIDVVIDRLLAVVVEARATNDPAVLNALTVEVDALAVDVVRYAREREPDARTMGAVSIAIETAKSVLTDRRSERADAGREPDKPRSAPVLRQI